MAASSQVGVGGSGSGGAVVEAAAGAEAAEAAVVSREAGHGTRRMEMVVAEAVGRSRAERSHSRVHPQGTSWGGAVSPRMADRQQLTAAGRAEIEEWLPGSSMGVAIVYRINARARVARGTTTGLVLGRRDKLYTLMANEARIPVVVRWQQDGSIEMGLMWWGTTACR